MNRKNEIFASYPISFILLTADQESNKEIALSQSSIPVRHLGECPGPKVLLPGTE